MTDENVYPDKSTKNLLWVIVVSWIMVALWCAMFVYGIYRNKKITLPIQSDNMYMHYYSTGGAWVQWALSIPMMTWLDK